MEIPESVKLFREKKKQYREATKEHIKAKSKEYYEANKEMLREKNKKYVEENKETIKEKMKIKATCECGCVINKNDLSRRNMKNI